MSEEYASGTDPLRRRERVAHWGCVYDQDGDQDGFVSGEFLLRGDGVLLRRYGGGSSGTDGTRWRFGPWEPVSWWPGEMDPERALRLVKARGYGVSEPGPVAVDASEAGPIPGHPERARDL